MRGALHQLLRKKLASSGYAPGSSSPPAPAMVQMVRTLQHSGNTSGKVDTGKRMTEIVAHGESFQDQKQTKPKSPLVKPVIKLAPGIHPSTSRSL